MLLKHKILESLFVVLFIILSFLTSSAATITYTYDNLNRLTKIDYGNSATEEYTYDPSGNRLTLVVTGSSGPDITTPPTSHNFGTVNAGSHSPAQPFTISNIGTLALALGTITLTDTDASAFSIQSDACSGQTIAPAGTCAVQVIFAPTTAGTKSAVLSIASNDPDTPVLSIALEGTGTGIGPIQYTVTPSAGANGSINPNTPQTVNSGGSIAFTAAPANGYAVDQWLVNNVGVQTGDTSYTLSNITANQSVQVTFKAVLQAPVITSASVASGAVGQSFSYPITASNNPTSFSASGLPTGLSLNPTTGVISGTPTAAGTLTIPLNATNASGTGTGTLMLTIAKATPTITWSAPAAITYGTALSGTQLNATATVLGTFTYTPVAGTVLNAGANQPLSVTFTPTDSANYHAATGATTLTITKAPLTAKADDKTTVQGVANPALTMTYTGFVHGEAASVLDTPPTISTTATPSSPVGTYPITLAGGSDNNYTLTLHNGTLTVTVGGVQGDYFDDSDLTTLALTRLDPTIDFDWGLGAPDASLPPDAFSVRWTGKLLADFDETYTFETQTDDGVRLWIDGSLVVDAWHNGRTVHVSMIALGAGWHDLKLEFFEETEAASVQLFWSSPSTPHGIIPQDHLRPPAATGAAPMLAWTGETGCVADGLDPATGDTTTTFTYCVLYTDADGDAPLGGAPRLHILEHGVEIHGSPFVMTFVRGLSTTGAFYTYSTTLPRGRAYTYYFDATDTTGRQAVATPIAPTPTAPVVGPQLLLPNGDVNTDGQFTPADALMTFRHFLGLTEMSSGQRFDADVNEDGHITPGDALCIFRAFLRLPSCMD